MNGTPKAIISMHKLYLQIVGQGSRGHKVFKVALLSDDVHAWEEKIFEVCH